MLRVRDFIDVKGRKCWALFDMGARNTYIVPEIAALLVKTQLERPFHFTTGREVREVRQAAILDAEVKGCKISTHAFVIDEISKDKDGRPIEVLFGHLAMSQWCIRIHSGEVDLSPYSKHVEFWPP
jgi:hypothetical protein